MGDSTFDQKIDFKIILIGRLETILFITMDSTKTQSAEKLQKLSELIERLTVFMEKHGDMEVGMQDDHGCIININYIHKQNLKWNTYGYYQEGNKNDNLETVCAFYIC